MSDEKTFCAVAALNHVPLTLIKCTTEPETQTPSPQNSLHSAVLFSFFVFFFLLFIFLK